MTKRRKVNLNIQDFKGELATFNGKSSLVYSNGLAAFKKLSRYEGKDSMVFFADKWKDKIWAIKISRGMKCMVNDKDVVYTYSLNYSLSKEGMFHIYTNIEEFRKASPLIQMLESLDVPYKMIIDIKTSKEPNIITLTVSFDITIQPLPMKVKRVYRMSNGDTREIVYWLDKLGRISKTEIRIVEAMKEEDKHAMSVSQIQKMMDEMCEGEELIEDRVYEHTS